MTAIFSKLTPADRWTRDDALAALDQDPRALRYARIAKACLWAKADAAKDPHDFTTADLCDFAVTSLEERIFEACGRDLDRAELPTIEEIVGRLG